MTTITGSDGGKIVAAEIKTRAARRIGEISKGLEKVKPVGRNGKLECPRGGHSKTAALSRAGLTRQAANRCEKIAEIPESEFEAIIAESRAKQQGAGEGAAGGTGARK